MFEEHLYERDEERIKGDIEKLRNILLHSSVSKKGHALDFVLNGLRKMVAANVPVKYIISHSFAKFKEINIYEVDYDEGFYYLNVGRNGKPIPSKFSSTFKTFLDDIRAKVVSGSSIAFFGYNSSGKTHAATYLLMKAIEKGCSGYYIDMASLYEVFNSGRWGQGLDAKFVKFLLSCDFLVIDELGKEAKTENSINAFEQIVKLRAYNGKTTVACSNLDFIDREDKHTNKKVSQFKERYGNSVYEAFVEHYHVFQFSREGEFRRRKRKRWNEL